MGNSIWLSRDSNQLYGLPACVHMWIVEPQRVVAADGDVYFIAPATCLLADALVGTLTHANLLFGNRGAGWNIKPGECCEFSAAGSQLSGIRSVRGRSLVLEHDT